MSLPVAILAGGLATRLKPVTEKIPKALVPVCGVPFLDHQLQLLARNGIERVVVLAGYRGEMIRERYGSSAHGIELDYLFDGPKLLGTGGALRAALAVLGEAFFVLYGDSYLPIPFRPVEEAFRRSQKPALMTVFRNSGRWDRSNVVFQNGELLLYDKREQLPEMDYIDYGLSVITPEVLTPYPEGESFDLAEPLHELSVKQKLAGFEVDKRFYEIGSFSGLAELESFLHPGHQP